MKDNVITANVLDCIRRRVRIILDSIYGKALYHPAYGEVVVLTVYQDDEEFSERECLIENGEIIADFPVFRRAGIYRYKIALHVDSQTRYTFVESEIIIGRSNAT